MSDESNIPPDGSPSEKNHSVKTVKMRCRSSETAPPKEEPRELPYLSFPCGPGELFVPEKHLPEDVRAHAGPSRANPPLPLAAAARANPGLSLIPRPEDCYALWDRYEMLDNIRAHSQCVADLALAMALKAKETGMNVCPDTVYAAGLLHDLAKTYTIAYGGHHAQLGASWVMRETGNGPIAQAVLYHVHWPWEEDARDDSFFTSLAIVYADKRVMHDTYVGLDERFDDLVDRYAVNDYVRSRIDLSHQQGKRVEEALSRRLGVDLHEYTIDSGRLVKRT